MVRASSETNIIGQSTKDAGSNPAFSPSLKLGWNDIYLNVALELCIVPIDIGKSQ